MRIVLVTVGVLLLFVLLVRVAPVELVLPLYCLFTIGGVGYVLWERRQIGTRREGLERDLERHRLEAPQLPWGEEE